MKKIDNIDDYADLELIDSDNFFHKQKKETFTEVLEIMESPLIVFFEDLAKEITFYLRNKLNFNTDLEGDKSMIIELLGNEDCNMKNFFVPNKFKKLIADNIAISILNIVSIDNSSDKISNINNYINKKFPVLKGGKFNPDIAVTKINKNQLFIGQKKLFKLLDNLINTICDYNKFFGENIDFEEIRLSAVNKQDITIENLKLLLIILSELIINNDLEEEIILHIKKILKILFLYLKFISLMHINKDDLILGVFHKKNLFNDIIDDKLFNSYLLCTQLPSNITFIVHAIELLDTIGIKDQEDILLIIVSPKFHKDLLFSQTKKGFINGVYQSSFSKIP